MSDLSRLKKSNKQDVPGDANEINQHRRGIARRYTGRKADRQQIGHLLCLSSTVVAPGLNLPPPEHGYERVRWALFELIWPFFYATNAVNE